MSLSFATPAAAQTASPPAITVNGEAPTTAMQQGDASQSSPALDDKNINCPTGLEQILPGDYYACEARAAYGKENYGKMLDMLNESAYWANKDAQYTLGLAYFNGDTEDIEQNRPLGLAWLALAAERKNPQYQLANAQARAQATAAELREAQKLLKKMTPRYGDSVAATRAIRRFNQTIRDIDDAAREGGIVDIPGFSPFPESAFVIANKLHDEATMDFSTFQGTVVVGKPEWVQNNPGNGAPATASSTGHASSP
ncbi:hypothetical protein GCM10007863_29960 [Dyella mobilis]|nr:hypothetical protein GCM10007863_29960 [Dyella mobilis]